MFHCFVLFLFHLIISPELHIHLMIFLFRLTEADHQHQQLRKLDCPYPGITLKRLILEYYMFDVFLVKGKF